MKMSVIRLIAEDADVQWNEHRLAIGHNLDADMRVNIPRLALLYRRRILQRHDITSPFVGNRVVASSGIEDVAPLAAGHGVLTVVLENRAAVARPAQQPVIPRPSVEHVIPYDIRIRMVRAGK